MSQTTAEQTAEQHKPAIVDELYEVNDTNELKRVIYRDDYIVITRSEDPSETSDDTTHYTHDMYTVEEFTNEQAYGYMNKVETTSSIPKANQKTVSNTNIQQENNEQLVLNTNENTDAYTHENTDASESNGVDDVELLTTPEAGDESKPREQWSDVQFVGENIEQRLYERNIETKADVRVTKQEDLCEIPGISEQTAKNLKAYARKDETVEKWSDLPFIGSSIEQRLHEHGFETKTDITDADINTLYSIPQVGEKVVESLIAYATTHPTTDTADTTDAGTDQHSGEREKWNEVKYIGDFVMRELYEHGFETVDDLSNATDAELDKVTQLGDKARESLKTHVQNKQLNNMTA